MSLSITLAGLCVCLVASVSADSRETLYKKVGSSVDLSTDLSSVTGSITSMRWEHGPDLAIEWDGNEVESFRHFKGRSGLNVSTGVLTITGLTREDSGRYTAEINGKTTSRTLLKVISPVPKPSVSVSSTPPCNTESTACLLSCDGDTEGAEPVTYSWRIGDLDLSPLPNQHQHNITKEKDPLETSISCSMKNPVSYEHSQSINNPLYHSHEDTDRATATGIPTALKGIVVFFSLIVLVLVPIFIHRCKAGVWFYEKESWPWEADFWERQASSARVDDTDNDVSPRPAQGQRRTERAEYKTNGIDTAESNATEEKKQEEEGLMPAGGPATPEQTQ